MPKFEPGDRVRFNSATRAELSEVEHGPGTVIDHQPLDNIGVWLQIHWDNDNWSTEKPEWLEKI